MKREGTVIFASGRGSDFDIFSLDLANEELLQLTEGRNMNDQPRWSPDGKQIAYLSDRNDGVSQVWLMDADGSNKTLLTEEKRYHAHPCWSADGKRIAYCANLGENDEVEIWTQDITGGKPELLVASPGIETEPCWSPDGERILMASPRSGNYDIWEFHITTREWRQLTEHDGKDYAPSYSPNGELIAFVSNRDPKSSDKTKDSDIWLMRSDGTKDPVRLTYNRGSDLYVSWSPTGMQVIYCASPNLATAGRIQVIDLDNYSISRLSFDRSELEAELTANVQDFGLFSKLTPDFVQRFFVDKNYFGNERYPQWKL